MRKFRMVAVALGFLGVAGVLTATPASAEAQASDQIGVQKAVEEAASSPATGAVPHSAVVVYWGFNATGEFFQTLPLDASVPANRGVQNADQVLPLDAAAKPIFISKDGQITTQSAAAQQPLYCERYVSAISLSAGDLLADADQRCTGAFVNHWMDYRFERSSWRGWLGYTNWQTSSSTSSYRNVWRFAIDCGAPEDTGIYDYRLNTRGYARHIDGTVVGGGEVYGQQGRYACGGGNGS